MKPCGYTSICAFYELGDAPFQAYCHTKGEIACPGKISSTNILRSMNAHLFERRGSTDRNPQEKTMERGMERMGELEKRLDDIHRAINEFTE